MNRRHRVLALGLLLGALGHSETLAQTGANVLLVVNDNSPESLRVGEHYRTTRGVPDTQEVHVRTAVAEDISREAYEAEIEAPIAGVLARERIQDRVVYIVLTRGVPIRIAGTLGRDGTTASVDSELALLYRKMVRGPYSFRGPLPNPLFSPDGEPANAPRFDRRSHDIYLVTRLDGFSVEDVIALIDRGAAPVRTGIFLLRPRLAESPSPVERKGNEWLEASASRLRRMDVAERVSVVTGDALPADEAVIGFYSWGAMDRALRRRQTGLAFVPGSIGSLYAGTAARTFREPPAGWAPGGRTGHAGSTDALAADLVREGLTGAAGHVSEGYLDGMIRPDILFPAYAAGLTLGESFYAAMPYLSWQTVVLGDPLCAPFQQTARDDLTEAAAMDPVTELPPHFSRRRLEALAGAGIEENAAKLFLRAESRQAREDRSGTIQALREALAVAPRFYPAALRLALLLEQSGDAAAVDAYRRVLDIRPADLIALNNLALLVAEGGEFDEALALAERAQSAAPRTAAVADTLGWIHHLRGDDAEAARLLDQAASGAPRNAEIRLHAAIVFLSLGNKVRARRELDAALALDPSLVERSEARRLLDQLR